MERTVSVSQFMGMKFDTIELSGEWRNCIGSMSRHGVVFIWGKSGNGKTSAALNFCKELTRFGKVLYISLEEGYSETLQRNMRFSGVADCGSRFQILRKTTLEELDARLSKKRSAEFVAIDSFQYLGISYAQYAEFKQKHPDKMLIFISQCDGNQPAGRAAKRVMYDADLKLWVEGYAAFSKGRFIGETGKAVIWDRKSEDYRGIDNRIED